MLFSRTAIVLGSVAGLLAACGGGTSAEDEEEYLATLCRSTGQFFADLVDDPDDAREAASEWFDTMSAVKPPSDLKEANQEFLRTLGSARITGNLKELEHFGDLRTSVREMYENRTADIPACASTNPFRP